MGRSKLEIVHCNRCGESCDSPYYAEIKVDGRVYDLCEECEQWWNDICKEISKHDEPAFRVVELQKGSAEPIPEEDL